MPVQLANFLIELNTNRIGEHEVKYELNPNDVQMENKYLGYPN